jgi:hypothetical protein
MQGLDGLELIHPLTERRDDAVMLQTVGAHFVHFYLRNRHAGQIRLGQIPSNELASFAGALIPNNQLHLNADQHCATHRRSRKIDPRLIG